MSKRNQKNTPQKDFREISSDTKKRAAILIANTALLTFIYFGAMALNEPILSMIVTFCFFGGFGGFLVAYLIYNRGFTRKDITVEMLPDHWSSEKKAKFIADGKTRQEKSKWVLSWIISLMIPIALDAIYLFTWPLIQNLFNL